MARIRNKRNEKRVKLYRKVRNVSSWGTLGVLLFLNTLFIVAAIYIAGFNIQYFFETKLAENYTELEHVAKLYEAGRENEAFLKYIESGIIEFIVRDKSGNVIYQKGAFSAVDDGQINLKPDNTAVKAAKDAMNGWDPTGGCLFYYNPQKTSNAWIRSRPIVVRIGEHVFCK